MLSPHGPAKNYKRLSSHAIYEYSLMPSPESVNPTQYFSREKKSSLLLCHQLLLYFIFQRKKFLSLFPRFRYYCKFYILFFTYILDTFIFLLYIFLYFVFCAVNSEKSSRKVADFVFRYECRKLQRIRQYKLHTGIVFSAWYHRSFQKLLLLSSPLAT